MEIIKCPNCKGELIYDASKKKMRCLWCRSEMQVENFKEIKLSSNVFKAVVLIIGFLMMALIIVSINVRNQSSETVFITVPENEYPKEVDEPYNDDRYSPWGFGDCYDPWNGSDIWSGFANQSISLSEIDFETVLKEHRTHIEAMYFGDARGWHGHSHWDQRFPEMLQLLVDHPDDIFEVPEECTDEHRIAFVFDERSRYAGYYTVFYITERLEQMFWPIIYDTWGIDFISIDDVDWMALIENTGNHIDRVSIGHLEAGRWWFIGHSHTVELYTAIVNWLYERKDTLSEDRMDYENVVELHYFEENGREKVLRVYVTSVFQAFVNEFEELFSDLWHEIPVTDLDWEYLANDFESYIEFIFVDQVGGGNTGLSYERDNLGRLLRFFGEHQTSLHENSVINGEERRRISIHFQMSIADAARPYINGHTEFFIDDDFFNQLWDFLESHFQVSRYEY